MATAEANDLITEVTQLPVQPGAAMRLLWMLEDPRTSAADLGRLIESDPALSTQVIRLANTAFYGLSGKVSSAWRAVTVLGLATVRAIATTAAFDLFSEKGRSVPDDFWPHSVTTAAAAAAIARRVGIQPNDAFSSGLLARPRQRARVPPGAASLRRGARAARRRPDALAARRRAHGVRHDARRGRCRRAVGHALPGRDGRGDRRAPHAARGGDVDARSRARSPPTRLRSRSTT